jgi:tetratricopeptide (TPR) repeat protein
LLLAEPSGGWLFSALNADLAELLVAVGRVDEAEAAATEAMAKVPEDDPAARGEASVAAACVAAARGNRETTVQRAREALEHYVDMENGLELARAQVALGKALGRVGERDEAAALLQLAGNESSAMGATTLLAAAAMALSELEAG